MDGVCVKHVKVAKCQLTELKKGLLAIFGTEEKITVKRHQFSKMSPRCAEKNPSDSYLKTTLRCLTELSDLTL